MGPLAACSCSGGSGSGAVVLLGVGAVMWIVFNWIEQYRHSRGKADMNMFTKISVVVALVVAIGAVILAKNSGQSGQPDVKQPAATENAVVSVQPEAAGPDAQAATKLPRLVDLGADKCIPCKAMKPILDELRTTYAGRFDVVFIDVWVNPDKAREHKIEIIPTQIFFDASGKELFRHQGFYGREEILAKWKELGIDVGGMNK
jgi:thioredoxin 1